MGVAGDETTGRAPGIEVAGVDFARVAPELLAQLRGVPGLTATASDVLDELGLRLAVPAGTIVPRTAAGPVAGHVVTLAYLPERRTPRQALDESADPGLAHLTAFDAAGPVDVVVIDARGGVDVSVLGEWPPRRRSPRASPGASSTGRSATSARSAPSACRCGRAR